MYPYQYLLIIVLGETNHFYIPIKKLSILFVFRGKKAYFIVIYFGIIIASDITTDGEVHTCNERVEEVDEQNKKITFKLFDGDIEKYKVFKVILEVINKADGSSAVRWTIDYEKKNENIDTPNGWMDYLSKGTRDIDGHLVKGEKVAP